MGDSKYSIGVIVARFQIHDLHEGHHYIIKQVTENHRKTIIFLGVPKFVGGRKNPLDFDTRKRMIQQQYPDIVVLALPDQGHNYKWAQELDRRIREVFPQGEVLLYGSRDSFIPYYKDGKGKFDTKELEPFGTFTGTDVRKLVSEEIKNSIDFRSGIIYHTYSLNPRIIPTTTIVPISDDGKKILVSKKYNDDRWRFISGFTLTTDSSIESAARRIMYKDAGKAEFGDFKYIGSCQIPDWRFRGEDDKVLTTIITCKYVFGNILPSDDIGEIKWVDIENVSPRECGPKSKNICLIMDHLDILNILLNK